MSIVNNFPTEHVVSAKEYDVDLAADILIRTGYFKGVTPIIKYGCEVTAGSGLTVNVSAGAAQGKWVQFTQMDGDPFLPTDVEIPDSVVTIPASSTGWIVLNANILPGPGTIANQYVIQADNNGGPPVVQPMFTTTLETVNPKTSYPYTQIVLAKVVTDGSGVTTINTDYFDPTDPAVVPNRSFDITNFMKELNQENSIYVPYPPSITVLENGHLDFYAIDQLAPGKPRKRYQKGWGIINVTQKIPYTISLTTNTRLITYDLSITARQQWNDQGIIKFFASPAFLNGFGLSPNPYLTIDYTQPSEVPETTSNTYFGSYNYLVEYL